MAATAAEILQRLEECGLVSAEAARDLAVDADVSEPAAFLDRLVARGVITAYQRHAALGSAPLVLGEYVLLDRLGKGGMGVVYEARHRRMNRLAAIKVLAPDLVGTPEGEQRFYREVQAIARLNHPNIAQAYDASEHEGLHYLVMELIEGRDLAGVIGEQGPMALGDALDAVRQAAEALACAHAAGIVHRDVKPANLLRMPDGRVKLLDLGIARLRDPGVAGLETLTQTGWMLGSVPYMAPEHAEDPRAADHRSDVFSLGCTLHVLLTGRLPFEGTTAVKQILAAREKPTPDLREILPRPARAAALLDELQALFARMVAKSPAQRVSAMREVASEIESILRRAPPELLALRAPPPQADGPPPPAPRSDGGGAGDATHRMERASGARPGAAAAPTATVGPAVRSGSSSAARPPARPAPPRPRAAIPPPPAPSRGPAWAMAVAAIALVAMLAAWLMRSRDEVPAAAPSPSTTAEPLPAPTAAVRAEPAPVARAHRPAVARTEDLLAAARLRGFRAVTGGGVRSDGGASASISAPYSPTPGHVLTVTLAQDDSPASAAAALSIGFTGSDGRSRSVDLDRPLGDGTRGARLDAGGEEVVALGEVLRPGATHEVEIEVHPSAVLVFVDGREVIAQGRPGEPPPSAQQRVHGTVELVTDRPTHVGGLTFGALTPPGGGAEPHAPAEDSGRQPELSTAPAEDPADWQPELATAPARETFRPPPRPEGGSAPSGPPRDGRRPPPRGGGPPPR